MKSCLVTGGAGFIGSHLVEKLVTLGLHVKVLDDLSTGSLRNLDSVRGSIEFIQGDAKDKQAVDTAMDGVDTIFHQAALPSVTKSILDPMLTHHQCVSATVSLLDAARRHGVKRLIYAASSSAYGNANVEVKSENLIPRPLSPYAAAKLAGEFYCQAFSESMGIETVALRYFNVFGPRQDPTSQYSAVIPRFITSMLRGESPLVYGDGKQSRDFTYVENVVQGNILAATAPSTTVNGKVFNIAMGQSTTLLTLIALLNDLLGTSLEPQFESMRQGDVVHSCADTSLATRDLKYSPERDLVSGLEQTVEYYRSWLAVGDESSALAVC